MSPLNINHAQIVNYGNHIHNMSIPPGLKNFALLTESLLCTAWRNKGIYIPLQGHTVTARSHNWLVSKHSRGLSRGCMQLRASWVALERCTACYNVSCSKNEVTRERSAMFKGIKWVDSWAVRWSAVILEWSQASSMVVNMEDNSHNKVMVRNGARDSLFHNLLQNTPKKKNIYIYIYIWGTR
jgi:hypothetical protein